MDLGGWRPEESRGDAGCCQTHARHAAVCVGKESGGSGGGQSLKSLLQRLPACLPGLQRGDKGEKRPAGRLEVSKHRKKPLEMLGTRPQPFSLGYTRRGSFSRGALQKGRRAPLLALGRTHLQPRDPSGLCRELKKKSTGRGGGGSGSCPPPAGSRGGGAGAGPGSPLCAAVSSRVAALQLHANKFPGDNLMRVCCPDDNVPAQTQKGGFFFVFFFSSANVPAAEGKK